MFSRDELLGGLPARRASTLLFAIEGRTAQLAAQTFTAGAWSLGASGTGTESDFLQALAAGRGTPVSPTIQDIERHVAGWAPLVPAGEVNLRAALARLLADKYRFTYAAVPGLRAALGLDDSAVAAAFERLYQRPITSLYLPAATWRDRWRWAWAAVAARLENLSPFWLAFVLTLPVGPGLLALPIALAGVGPLAGLALLLLFGLINALTVAALAESVARSGITRFGLGYLGQLVADYLGGAGSLFLTAVSFLNNVLVLVVFYLGIAGTLEAATGLPSGLWIVLVFAAGLYFVSRRSLTSTIASTLVISLINVTLLVALPLLALPSFRVANLAYLNLPFLNGQAFDPGVLRLVFGVMLTNYFSHLLVANYGKVVLQRDPTGRAWIWGSVAAIGATTLISCLWVLLINGTIAPGVLAAEAGTVLVPLADLAGPIVDWMGSVVVVLGLGLASIHLSLGTFYLSQERLPSRLGTRARLGVAVAPLVVVFLLAEWLAVTGTGSFAGLLSFIGVIALSLLGGVFPVLLLAASRRKGDFTPQAAYRLVGHPVVLVLAYLTFLSAIFVHGLFIWESALERSVTLAIGLLVLAATVVMLRRGALRGRVVIELRDDQRPGGRSFVAVTAVGKPAAAPVCLVTANGQSAPHPAPFALPAFIDLRSVIVQLPATSAAELKVWVHRLTPEGNSVGLPARAVVRLGGVEADRVLPMPRGQALLAFTGQAAEVTVVMGEATGEA